MVFQTKSAVVLFLLCLAGLISCNKENAISTVSLDNISVLPSTHGENISSLLSDSGITVGRMQAKIWDIYENDTAPYWFFPQGIYIERFDSLFRVVAHIKADTAYYLEKKSLWQLVGNVHAQNEKGDKFDTSELFWNQREPANSMSAVYTDKFTRIDEGDRIIFCDKGIRANQSLNAYHFYEVSGIFYVDESATATNPSRNDSIQSATK